jgi:hypothetical protein
VPRVVIAVCPPFAHRDARPAVGARARTDRVHVWRTRARPEQRHGDRNEGPPADAACAGRGLDHPGMKRAGERGVEANRRERHVAPRTASRVIDDHVGIHRAGEGDRRQRRLRCARRRERDHGDQQAGSRRKKPAHSASIVSILREPPRADPASSESGERCEHASRVSYAGFGFSRPCREAADVSLRLTLKAYGDLEAA